MPLPGGPSDKYGNRYELRWTIYKFVELITGRLDWIRIEPPGENAIEFRCRTSSGEEEVWQIKRGIAAAGRWTISALSEVLSAFGTLLKATPNLSCVFASEHAAWELSELAERARSARHVDEFTSKFLEPERLRGAWEQIISLWRLDSAGCWQMLRRVRPITISESELVANLDMLLQELLDAPPATSRAVLTQLAIESIHLDLKEPTVTDRLRSEGIRRFPTRKQDRLRDNLLPVLQGIKRTAVLEQIREAIAAKTPNIILGGIPGIGKSTVASQLAAEWSGPVCWIDGGLTSTAAEALDHIGNFLKSRINDSSLVDHLSKGAYRTDSVSKLAARIMASHRGLVIWDSIEKRDSVNLIPVINAMAGDIIGGAQLVTTSDQSLFRETPASASLHVERLTPSEARALILDAYPEARLPDLEASEEVTSGHPYLIRLLCGTAQTLDLHSAVELFQREGANAEAVISRLLAELPDTQKHLLARLCWVGLPFSAQFAISISKSLEDLQALSFRYLVIRYGPETYRVHSIVTKLIRSSTAAAEENAIHKELALLLSQSKTFDWVSLRALLMHATKAGLDDLRKKAAELLLQCALQDWHWPLAKEAAEALVEAGVASYYPHFILGKAARIYGDCKLALNEYAKAETHAKSDYEVNVAKYERAAVLVTLGQDHEAEPIFRALAQSENPVTKAQALVALGLMIAKQRKFDEAVPMVEEAHRITKKTGFIREEADSLHALAKILSDAGRLAEAREHLLTAHKLRLSISKKPGASDIYGWYHLMLEAVEVERRLGNAAGLASAAHACWRCAAASGNIQWEAESAYMLCIADGNIDDEEIQLALSRLRSWAADFAHAPESRLQALNGLILSYWSFDLFTEAIEAILDLMAISIESDLDHPIYAHGPREQGQNPEKILRLPDDVGYLLTVPENIGFDGFMTLISEILSRRPELKQYASMMFGEQRDDKKP